MRFTELLAEIQATYPEQPRKFHVIATRYYLNVISPDELRQKAHPDFRGRTTLTYEQVETIIRNR